MEQIPMHAAPAVSNRTTPAVPLVQGTTARRVAGAQGHTWGAIVAASDAADHQATGAQLDAEDDQLRDLLADKVTVALAIARRERAYGTHAVLTVIAAIVRRQCELDPSIDLHLIVEAGAGVTRVRDSAHHANAVLEEILTGRPQCGATRPAMVVPGTGQVIPFAPCPQRPGHEAETCHYFEAAPS